MNSFRSFVKVMLNKFYYKRKFAYLAPRASIRHILRIDGGKNIYVGNARIGHMTWLAAKPLTNAMGGQI